MPEVVDPGGDELVGIGPLDGRVDASVERTFAAEERPFLAGLIEEIMVEVVPGMDAQAGRVRIAVGQVAQRQREIIAGGRQA